MLYLPFPIRLKSFTKPQTPPELDFVSCMQDHLKITTPSNNDLPPERPTTNGSKPPVLRDKGDVFDASWVAAEMKAVCKDSSMVADMVPSVVSLLTSSKTDDELQNELFDLLGFERFTLIQKFLEKRKIISADVSRSDTRDRLEAVKTELKNRSKTAAISSVSIMSTAEKHFIKQV